LTINERCKLVREKSRLSQRAFADRLSISGPAIARIESGVNNPSDQTLVLISREFGISYAWLKNGIGDMIEERDEDDDVNRLMLGESEFAKSVFRALAKLPPEAWDLFQQFVETLKADQKKPGD